MDLSNDPGTRIEPYLGTTVHIVRSRERRPNHPRSGCAFSVDGIEAAESYDLKSFANRLGERTYEQLLEASTTRRVSGVACPIASIDDLISAKRFAGRDSIDRADVSELEKILDIQTPNRAAIRPPMERGPGLDL